MKKCENCFYYDSDCFHMILVNGIFIKVDQWPPGYGCSRWRDIRGWVVKIAQKLTNFWYDHIRSFLRRYYVRYFNSTKRK